MRTSPHQSVYLVRFLVIIAHHLFTVSSSSRPAVGGGSSPDHRRSSSSAAVELIGATAADLQCPPCDRIHCWPRRPSRLRCPGGTVLGVCDCCPVCARLEGQPCGGRWNYLGRCDAGLRCSAAAEVVGADRSSSDEAKVDINRMSNRVLRKEQQWNSARELIKAANAAWKPEGRCQQGQEMNDSPQPAVKCLPPCTPEFCQKNVKQLCSANDNSERRQPCQADCQHTSCYACRFRHPAVDCSDSIRCSSASDTDCLRRFGRCLRRQQCAARSEFPCRITNYADAVELDVKFVCVVPECATSSP